MKTSRNLLQADKSLNEETPKKLRNGNISKFIIAIIMLSYITLLTSCLVFVPFHGHGDRGHHDNGRHRGRD